MYIINFFAKVLKFIFDRLFGLISLIFLSPIFLIIGFLVYFDDGLPIFFKQKRIGIKGKFFTMFKFRTMRNGSEKFGTGYYCFENDPRITRTGIFLRKYSLDELPQIFNIIKAEMSFIGPRPPIFDELENEIINKENLKVLNSRIKVRPGLTGYSQVIMRNEGSWNEKLYLDNIYLSQKEFKRIFIDLLIVFKTIMIILFPKGTYDVPNNEKGEYKKF